MDKEKSSSAGPKLVEIDLTKLTLPELTHQAEQLDQEITLLQNSVRTLKVAQSKFQESKKSVEKVQNYSAGQTLLVPLTGSMYVDGKLEETNVFIINVGTGYYLKKDAEGAKDYFTRRLTYLSTHIENIQNIGNDRSRIKDAILSVIQSKIVQMQQQQPPQTQTQQQSISAKKE